MELPFGTDKLRLFTPSVAMGKGNSVVLNGHSLALFQKLKNLPKCKGGPTTNMEQTEP